MEIIKQAICTLVLEEGGIVGLYSFFLSTIWPQVHVFEDFNTEQRGFFQLKVRYVGQ